MPVKKAKICGTCRYWSLKALPNVTQAGGRCLNKKVADSIRLHISPPDDMIFLSSDDREKFLEEMRENVELRFDGDTFSCIYYDASN